MADCPGSLLWDVMEMRAFARTKEMLADAAKSKGGEAEVEITPLVRRGYTITGSFGARTREDLPAVAAIAAAGGFDTTRLVTRRYTLDNADAAYQALARGEITGRAVVVMD